MMGGWALIMRDEPILDRNFGFMIMTAVMMAVMMKSEVMLFFMVLV